MRRARRSIPVVFLFCAWLTSCAPPPGVSIAGTAPPSPSSPSPEPSMPAPSPPPAVPSPPSVVWVAFGDSILQDTFRPPFDWPLKVLNLAERGDTSADAGGRLASAMAQVPAGGGVFAVGFGTNDVYAGVSLDAYRANMTAIATTLARSGRTPILGQIPGSTDPRLKDRLLEYNRVLRDLERALELPKGPDLYTYFNEHPEELLPDGVHLQAEGTRSARRLWALAAKEARLPGF